MYINRALILAISVFILFSPVVEIWVFNTEGAWYRPFELWLLVIVAAYWNQRSRYPDEL